MTSDIKIGAGELVVLSTLEQFTMPEDLVGIVNVKFKSALQGLMLVFGSRVDPGYGRDLRDSPSDAYTGQRLYLVIYNIADKDVHVRPRDSLFMVEFHTIDGAVRLEPRQNNDTYVAGRFAQIRHFGFLAGVGSRVEGLKEKVGRLEGIERYVNFVVVGAIILLSVTILGVAAGFVMAFWGQRPTMRPTSELRTLPPQAAPTSLEGRVVSLTRGTITVGTESESIFDTGEIGIVIRTTGGLAEEAEERYIATVRFVGRARGVLVARPIETHEPIRIGDTVRRLRADGSGPQTGRSTERSGLGRVVMPTEREAGRHGGLTPLAETQ